MAGAVDGAGGVASRVSPEPGVLVERLRGVHLRMVDAVLSGEGLGRVAALCAEAVGMAGAPARVAIVVPRLGAAVLGAGSGDVVFAGGEGDGDGRMRPLARYVAERLRERPAPVPEGVTAEVPIAAGDEKLGAVLLIGGEPSAHAAEFLHLAAVACLTEVAVEEAREEVEQNLRGTFLEELRGRPDLEPREMIRRAGRLGCDLSHGAVALCAALTSTRPRLVVATIAEEHPGALAQHMEDRVYAILPARGGDPVAPGPVARGDGARAEETLAGARRVARRLERHGTVGLSSFYSDPAELGRAVQEAELVLDVLERSDGPVPADIGTGTYRLLFRVLASHPEEVRSFYEDTVAPLVRYDGQYGTDLVGTLEAYLEHNGNMNATAAAIYAHRHTVSYRLDRVRELAQLDPSASEDREKLSLGLKAYRIIAPRLPR